LVVTVALAVLLAACSEGDPGAEGDVESLGALVPGPVAEELTRSGGCEDGPLWAADARGTLAVLVEGAAGEVVLPSEDVDVTVRHGVDLVPDLCSDDPAPAVTSPGVRGRVAVGEDDGCATFRIDGLEAEDGTTFGPIEGSGCAPG
jgi:hypothetical protein